MNDARQDNFTEYPAAGGAADPILIAISTFRTGLDDFNSNSPDDDAGAEAYAEKSFRAPLRVIKTWRESARTMDGAVEALRLARDADQDGDYEIVGPMLRSALSYLEMKN